MFEGLSDKLQATFKKIRGQNRISESNIEEALREIRLNLLEADVNFRVVKNFIERVKAKSLGQEVLSAVSPGQQFTSIVFEELKSTLGHEAVQLDFRTGQPPYVVMLVGLQGVGKTTTAAKLALHIRQKLGKKPGLIPADVYRPAAIEQLQILGKTNSIPTFASQATDRPEVIFEQAKKWAAENMIEVLILDTAGRLQIDTEMMGELERLKSLSRPSEVILVADAMLGQQSVTVAEGFHQSLGLTGLILTKVDGDARGGAALSIREVTGVPIKFLGTGEKVAALEVFHPDRLASRILDMGDVLSLVEKARDLVDEKEAQASVKKLMKNEFTLEDFLAQIGQLKKLGGMQSILSMLPGAGELQKKMKGMTPPDDEIKKIEAIIRSMTLQERRDPRVLNGSRRERIAQGSGTQVQDVNRLIKQFEEMKKMMSMMMKMPRKLF